MQDQNTPKELIQTGSRLPTKIPLGFAAMLLAKVSDDIESGNLDATLIAAFEDAKLATSEAVDRRIAFDAFIKSAIDRCKDTAKSWRDEASKLEKAHKRFLERTKEIVEANPDIPFKGNLGRFAIQKNNPSVECDVDEVDQETIDFLGIDPKYIAIETTYRIDKTKLSQDLKNGVEIPWARLKQSQRLVIKKQ